MGVRARGACIQMEAEVERLRALGLLAHAHNITEEVVLVTGGSGFLGSHIIPLLVACNAREVRLLLRNPESVPSQLSDLMHKHGDKITVVKGSITDRGSLQKALMGVTSAFHLAGLVVHSRTVGGEEMIRTNVEGMLNVVRACGACHVKKLVYASTSGVVGCSDSPSHFANDRSDYCERAVAGFPYYLTKIRAEREGRRLAKEVGVTLVCMRPAMLFGPGDARYRSTHSIVSYLRRSFPISPTGGISCVDVRDVALAFVCAMDRGRDDATYLLTAHNSSLRSFFTVLQQLTNVDPPFWSKIPWPVIITCAHVLNTYNTSLRGKWKSGVDPVKAEMTAMWWNVSPERAVTELGFAPRPIRDTLADTIDWVRRNPPPGGLSPSARL